MRACRWSRPSRASDYQPRARPCGGNRMGHA
jgi:hypothetical protein